MSPPSRADRIEGLLESEGLDLVIVGSPANVYYLSGLVSPAQRIIGEPAYCLWSAETDGPHVVMPGREMDRLVEPAIEVKGVYGYGSTNIYTGDELNRIERRMVELQATSDFDDHLDALLGAVGDLSTGGDVGVEVDAFDPHDYSRLEDSVPGKLRPIAAEVHDLRRRKSAGEIKRLRRAAEITEGAITAATEAITPGTTERDLADAFRTRVAEAGAEPFFVTVSFGRRTAYTHPEPRDTTISEGDLIRWDAGCRYEHYRADIGRTFAYGEAKGDAAAKYRALHDGLTAALDVLTDGVSTAEVYGVGVEAVRAAGIPAFADFSPNHLGHGIGLEVYDPPTITDRVNRLRKDMVLCLEPPYNELGYGGFLLEDEIVVTGDGYDPLTEAPDSLPIVG